MTADERLALLRIKLERAKKHFSELDRAIGAFYDSNPYEILVKRDPQTRRPHYYVSRINKIPETIAAISGDVIQNLRSVLDHLTNQLAIVGGNITPHVECNFPISNTASQYESCVNGKVKTLRRDAVEALLSLKAHKGGDGHDLWVLNRLNNIDKHRLLLTPVSNFRSLDLAAAGLRELKKFMATQGKEFEIPDMHAFFKPAAAPYPLEVGEVLFTGLPDDEPDEKMQFQFEVALNEPGIVECKPLVVTIQHLAQLVDNTVTIFRPCLG